VNSTGDGVAATRRGPSVHGVVDPLATFNVFQIQPAPVDAVLADPEDGDPAHVQPGPIGAGAVPVPLSLDPPLRSSNDAGPDYEKGPLTWENGACESCRIPDQEGRFSMGSSHTLDQLDIAFDDTHAIANAGLLLPATLAQRLGIEQTADALIDLADRPGAAHPGRKLLTLVHAMLAGGDCIDDADVLRCGQTSNVLGHRVMAPSTLGTFLRWFTFGHVRQLDRLTEQLLARAWAAGAGPGDGPMTMDLDSTVCQVHGHAKQGHPHPRRPPAGMPPALTAARCSRARQRAGRANTARGTARFLDELAGRVRRAGAAGS
jgi:Transposase DDE domain group 1